jgi:hypothetical protein
MAVTGHEDHPCIGDFQATDGATPPISDPRL